MRFDDQRKIMVEEQLIPRGILNQQIIEAFLKVPREIFVSEKYKEFAYIDRPLSIGHDQTISQPYMVALMMTLLEIKETDIVLEIGTGGGYQTALLAELAHEVYTIERIEELLLSAKKTLKTLDYKNVYFKIGDGCLGWVNALPQVSAFDKIIVSAASPDTPLMLLKQLKTGGKLIVPQGQKSFVQDLMVYEKRAAPPTKLTEWGGKAGEEQYEIVSRKHGECRFVPLIGEGAH